MQMLYAICWRNSRRIRLLLPCFKYHTSYEYDSLSPASHFKLRCISPCRGNFGTPSLKQCSSERKDRHSVTSNSEIYISPLARCASCFFLDLCCRRIGTNFKRRALPPRHRECGESVGRLVGNLKVRRGHPEYKCSLKQCGNLRV